MNKYRVEYIYEDENKPFSYHAIIVAKTLEGVEDNFYKFYPNYCNIVGVERVYGDAMDRGWD